METVQRVFRGHPGFLQVAIGQAGSVAVGAVFWFFVARLLQWPGAYGQVNWLISIASFAAAFCVLGWGKTIVAYYPKEGREELVGGATLIVLVASLAVGIAMGLILGPLVGLLIVGSSLFNITISYELGRRRYKRFMWISLIAKFMSLPLAVLLYFVFGLPGVLLSYAIPSLIFGILSLKHLGSSNPSIREAKEKAGFAFKALGADTTSSAMGFFDKILVGGIFGMVMLGLYQLASQIFALLGVLPGVMFTYMLPEKSAGAKTKEVEVLGLVASIALACSAIILSPVLISWAFPSFVGAVGIVQVMSLGIIPYAIVATKMSELYAHGRAGAVLTSYLVALAVEIMGIVVLGNYFGAIGLATSVVLLQTTLAATLLIYAREKV
jgi:O-antigen/teichoic acid export membrane protein